MLFVAKRTFDLFISLVGLALVGPVSCVVARQLDDGGPVFYRQERVGRLGRLFRIIKFRTMSVGPKQLA